MLFGRVLCFQGGPFGVRAMVGKNKLVKIFLLIIFALTAIFVSTSTVHGYAVMPDIEKHWAQSAIQRMVDEGIIVGYPDGTIQPDNYITRAEFVSLIARACNPGAGSGKLFSGISPETVSGSAGQPSGREILFCDITGHWAEEEIVRAYYHGIVSGYSDSKFGPDDLVSREQAFVMVVNVLKGGLSEGSSSRVFADGSHISVWAKEAVAKAAAAGIIAGYPDGTMKPQGHITRAEAAVLLSRCMMVAGELQEEIAAGYDRTGIYGPEFAIQIIDGNVTISTGGVVLRNTVISGNLTITENVGDGDVILNNVTVKGTTFIRGGGENSIHINGGQYNNIVVENAPNGNIRLVVTNTEGLQVLIAEEAVGAEIILEGVFDSIIIQADDIVLSIRSAAVIETVINEIYVPENVAGTVINIEKNSTVKKLVLDSVNIVNNAEDTVKSISGKKAGDSIILNPPKGNVSLYGRPANGKQVSTVKKKPEIVLEGIAEVAAVGLYDNFVMSVNPGDYGKENIMIKIRVASGDVNNFQLEFFPDEDAFNRDRRWKTIVFDEEGTCRFAPRSGSAVICDALNSVEPLDFRATWNAEGTYEFEIGIIAETAEGVFKNELVTAGYTVRVVGGPSARPVELTHSINGGPATGGALTVEAGNTEVVSYMVNAALANDISHVDNVLYICEVQKKTADGWGAASKGDFVITMMDGTEAGGGNGTQEINDTFKEDSDRLRGYWGSPGGFTLEEGMSIRLAIRFHVPGEYRFSICAIQAEKDVAAC
jgi:hypothetical protein